MRYNKNRDKELADKIWAFLDRWPSIVPSADFKSRFWSKVDMMESKKMAPLPHILLWRLAPAFVSALILISCSFIFIKARTERSNIAKDIELYQDLEFIQNMDILVDLDLLIEENQEG